jgi:hypothetical protein
MHCPLAAAAALSIIAGCAHREPRPPSRAEAIRVVTEVTRNRPLCLPQSELQDNESAGPDSDRGLAIVARRQADGTIGFDASRQARLDALVDAGLLALDPVRSRADGHPIRIYPLTALGRAHHRVLSDGSTGFCFGNGVVDSVDRITWRSFCGTSLVAHVRRHHEGIPAWAELPSVRAAFPEWIGSAAAARSRPDVVSLVSTPRGWEPPPAGGHNLCGAGEPPARERQIVPLTRSSRPGLYRGPVSKAT